MWKQPLFVIGFTVLAVLLVGSFAYEWLFGNVPRQIFFIEENGQVVEGVPISPKWAYPFGTDQFGYDLLGKLLIGAKYTVLAALSVAALRMLLAVPIGFLFGTYLQRHRGWISGLADSLHYIPLTIFAAYLLHPVLWMPPEGFSTTLTERIGIEVVLLALLTMPIVSMLIASEAALLYSQEYVAASRTLGASRFRIIRKHLMPQMREKLVVLYGQQVIETFVVFAHLGLLHLFLGGTKVSYDPYFGDPPMSIAYEWAGLFGSTFRFLQGAPWLPLSPVLFITLAILSVSFMMEGYIRAKQPAILKKRKLPKPLTLPDREIVQWNREQLRKKLVRLKEKNTLTDE